MTSSECTVYVEALERIREDAVCQRTCQNQMLLYYFLFLLVAPMISILSLSLFLPLLSLSPSLSPPLHSAGSLHHHQGLSTPRRAESGLAVPLPALLGCWRLQTRSAAADRAHRASLSPSDSSFLFILVVIVVVIISTQGIVHLSSREERPS